MAELNNSGAGQWSETDAGNTSPPPDGAPAGTFPSQAEGIWRAMMGAVKRFWDRTNGTVATTGSGGAYAYAPANAGFPTALVTGEIYAWRANVASVGNDTLNVNALGAKPIYKPGAGGMAKIAAGDIQTGQMVQTAYDAALNAGAGGFHLLSPVSNGGGVTSVNVGDQTNGGLSFAGGPITGSGTINGKLLPSDLLTKPSPTTSDSFLIMDAAASNAAKTATIAQVLALTTTGISKVAVQAFAASGTYVPASGMLYCIALCTGGGGGGAAGSVSSIGGGAGGAGGTAIKAFSAATIGSSQSVTIGAGGSAGSGGGNTTLGALLTGNGGAPGTSGGSGGAAGAGGSAGSGQLNTSGGSGTPGNIQDSSIPANGGGGSGGASFWGGGGAGAAPGTNSSGSAGQSYGAGGGGGAGAGGGAAGAGGVVLVIEFTG
jgi:hypothetical protein